VSVPVTFDRPARLQAEVAGEATRLVGAVLPCVEYVDPGQPAEVEPAVDTQRARPRPQVGADRHVLVVRLVRRRALPSELLGRLPRGTGVVDLIGQVGVVVLGLVVVPHNHPRERGVRRAQRRVPPVLGVPAPVVVQCGQLVQPRRGWRDVAAVRKAAVWVVLVDVVAEVEDHIEVLLGEAPVRGPVAVLEVLAAHHAEAQPTRVGEWRRGRPGTPDGAQRAADPEPVEVLPARLQPAYIHVHGVGELRPCERRAGPYHAVELLVASDLPLHRDRSRRHRPGVVRIAHQPGPEDDAVG
jgi:hypothetical protein